jgi:bifunctional non-homologous end joining protein LigD
MNLPRIQPINPTRIASAFDHEDFIFELKHDGFRAVAYIEDGTCRLISRKQIQYKSFAGLRTAMAKLPVKTAILDGELVCLDQDGRSQFRELMHRRRQDAAFYAFDLLWLDGQDLRGLPLLDRKQRLQRLLKGQAGLLYAEHIEAKGAALFQAICDKDLEGIVAKHRLAPYSTKPQSWFKVLNPDYSQKRGRKEMFDNFRERNGHKLPANTENPLPQKCTV